ncbi:hypothetical protein LTR08_006415 [Meristemomyces frigidus]|nr:hypothetical protein LTR08_006415 [Meristemomyces frigidus]
MLFSQASCVLALTTVVVAAPFAENERRWGGWGSGHGRPWWSPSSASSYLEFGKRFPGGDTAAPTCDLSQAVLPTGTSKSTSAIYVSAHANIASAPTALPAPAPGLSLSHVAIGRGTQNYTCDLSNATAIPVAVGAVATLFNVSCVAASAPDLLAQLPAIALNLPIPTTTNKASAAYQDLSGHHYFTDPTTPFFNLDTPLHTYGTGAFKKANSSAAPPSAPLGQHGTGNGSVAWLKLDAKNTAGQIFQEVYRTTTAGGNPPLVCTDMPAAFEVQYSAAYWLFEQQ